MNQTALDCLVVARVKTLRVQNLLVVQVEAWTAAGSVGKTGLQVAVGVQARANLPSLFPIALLGLQTIRELVDRLFGNIL